MAQSTPNPSVNRAGSSPSLTGRWRQLAAIGLFAVVLLAVSGCMRLNLAIDLHENDMASMQVDMAFQDEAIQSLGYTPEEFWAEAEAELTGDMPEGATIERYPEAGWTGARINIANTPITELGEFEDAGVNGLTITRDGNFYVFQAMSGLAEEMESVIGEVPAGVEDVQMTLALTCPGAVVESNGAITGNRVVWDLTQFSSAQTLTARCEAAGGGIGAIASGGFLARWWPVLLGAVLLLGIIAALAYFLRRRSHQERDLVPSNFEQTANWQTPGTSSYAAPQPYLAPRSEVDPGTGTQTGPNFTDNGWGQNGNR